MVIYKELQVTYHVTSLLTSYYHHHHHHYNHHIPFTMSTSEYKQLVKEDKKISKIQSNIKAVSQKILSLNLA